MAQNGIARTIHPAHTMYDGDTVFALSSGRHTADISAVGAFAAEALAQAVMRAVQTAKSVGKMPALSDLVSE
jgi:L-aminopeptidase/D-esterase-like protein